MNIPENKFSEIEELIGSDESVVGIDAKKTHILILYMLQQIQERLDSVESRLEVIEDQVDT